MRVSRIAALATALQLSLAQPFRHQPQKREDVIVTHTVWETVQAPDVIVYVDENGNFISQNLAAAPTPPPSLLVDPQVPAAVPAEPLATFEPAPEPEPQPPIDNNPINEETQQEITLPLPPAEEPTLHDSYAPANQEIPAPAPPPAEPAEPEYAAPPSVPEPEANQMIPEPDNSYGTRSGFGIGWSNYNGDESSSSCKPFEQADQEWAQLTEYDVVRVYGVDCEQPAIAFELAKKYSKKVFVGIYWLDERLEKQIDDIIAAVKDFDLGWDAVDTISVGNEDVHRGEKTPSEVIDFVSRAKTQLRDAGYQGPVVHVDSQDRILANPELCSEAAGDYIAANIHPFFNAHNTAEHAGDFVLDQIGLLHQCGMSKRRRRDNVRVRATEVGWPKAGDANGIAVPSKDNQLTAIESIKSKEFDQLILFSAFDNKWMKDGPNTFNTEKFWGILDP